MCGRRLYVTNGAVAHGAVPPPSVLTRKDEVLVLLEFSKDLVLRAIDEVVDAPHLKGPAATRTGVVRHAEKGPGVALVPLEVNDVGLGGAGLYVVPGGRAVSRF